MKKILIPIAFFYPSQIGGPCNSVYAITQTIKEQFEIFVLTTNYGIKDFDKPINIWNDAYDINIYYKNYTTFRDLYKINPFSYIKDIKPDIVYLNSVFSPLSQYFAFTCRLYKIHYLWSPRGEIDKGALGVKSTKKNLFVNIPFIKSNLKNAVFHFTHEMEKEGFSKRFPFLNKNKYFIIPNIKEDNLKNQKYKNPYPFEYLLYLGRISPKKNLQSLLKAFTLLNDASLKLIIAGDVNEDRDYYDQLLNLVNKNKMNDKIIFTNKRVEGSEKNSLYKNAKLFVLPSISENFGQVVVEALSLGTPVIASKGTPWQLLEQYEAGYWVEPDEMSIKNAICDYLRKNELEKEEMKKNAIKLSNQFDSNILKASYIKMFNEVINNESIKI